jgi:ketosteroid isomerase-like protein
MLSEEIKEIVCQYYQSLTNLDLEGWLNFLDEKAIILDPVGKPPLKLSEDAAKFFALLANFYEQFTITPEYLFASDDEAAVKWKMEVVAKNGKVAHAEGISVFEFNQAGKIQQMKSYWDEAAMKSQLVD